MATPKANAFLGYIERGRGDCPSTLSPGHFTSAVCVFIPGHHCTRRPWIIWRVSRGGSQDSRHWHDMTLSLCHEVQLGTSCLKIKFLGRVFRYLKVFCLEQRLGLFYFTLKGAEPWVELARSWIQTKCQEKHSNNESCPEMARAASGEDEVSLTGSLQA